MSFFPSLMGDFDDDPFMGHMRQMNRMMNSFFRGGSPFGGGMLGGGGGGAGPGGELMPFGGGPMMRGGGAPLMPFGFPDMSQMFQNGGGNCHSFSSSTITTMTNGPDGSPQVYQASQSVRSGPGGVKETKKSVADSRSGIKKLAIGHHIGDRAHIIEREHNVRSGEHIEVETKSKIKFVGIAFVCQEEEEEDDEECGVKIVEVDDDYEEEEEGKKTSEDAANAERNAEPVVYVTEEDTASKGGKSDGGSKGGHKSRGKKRSHEPEMAQQAGSKSQKMQNRP
ncbi:hypothetical protein LSTR_LSTR013734 [Laodelphax striatellus]|uniref:Myeloid leukemia factor n=1 Tax=Laodelphax striatellus TaxID=195883 RepID=A0A482XKD1_LAOST|nr:hypothetical protein LSTR_LSTR013734 [Laodelphax striatellus]